MSKFNDFSLLKTLQLSLVEKGLKTPTEIQSQAIPMLLDGKSIVGVAQTGSGKTLAYVLPILHRLKSLEMDGNPVSTESQPRACVMVPTRELGEQVAKVFKPFTHTTRLRVRSVLGGTPFEMSRRNIKGNFEVLVATPGRLIQLMDKKLVDLSNLQILVFDEADQMLDEGFLPHAHRIVEQCPSTRQMVLFSATMSPKVVQLVSELFADAVMVRGEGSHQIVASLKTVNKKILNGKRLPVLKELLNQAVEGGTILFTNTREQCDQLAAEMKALGHECVIYRGEMDKVERRKNLKAFREGKIHYLISTDLASRGLDVEHVGRVVNYHLPKQVENYIHRVGRTARAGRPGVVVNFVTERDEEILVKVDSLPKQKDDGHWPEAPEFKKKPKVLKPKGELVVQKRRVQK